jgi:hypothetical protein
MEAVAYGKKKSPGLPSNGIETVHTISHGISDPLAQDVLDILYFVYLSSLFRGINLQAVYMSPFPNIPSILIFCAYFSLFVRTLET